MFNKTTLGNRRPVLVGNQAANKWKFAMHHALPQVAHTHRQRFDFIGRLEHLAEDLEEMWRVCGLPPSGGSPGGPQKNALGDPPMARVVDEPRFRRALCLILYEDYKAFGQFGYARRSCPSLLAELELDGDGPIRFGDPAENGPATVDRAARPAAAAAADASLRDEVAALRAENADLRAAWSRARADLDAAFADRE